ncbi:MAG TPA: DUF1501 domain-containing protein [Gemmataceae bacterium]|jgi:hypothetical protein|nr:DUF1501 domain-containing protein [Gemmataceae bacterium]
MEGINMPGIPCPGPLRRRDFLRLGLVGLSSLTWPELLRRRAEARPNGSHPDKALLVVWLHGGASHLETYDPKPLAPSEYRGPYRAVATRVPGMRISELLPRHARVAHRFTLLRSLAHTGPCHDSGPQQLFTGFPITVNRPKPDHPDLFAVVDMLRPDPSRALPNNVGVPPIPYLGAAYLGPAHEPFAVHGDPNDPHFEVPNIGVRDRGQRARLVGRMQLKQRLDRVSRQVAHLGKRDAFDTFRSQAWNVLTGSKARRAFDLALEPDRVRDRYGRNTWGQRCLLARRLVEAGVDLVATTLNGPLCGRVGNWDDHAVNHHVFEAMKHRAPFFDQAVAALVEDLHDRGLDKKVLLVVGGDFGRTPRISYAASTGGGVASGAAGVIQPGRDHWPHAMSFLFSGGGIAEGQVIGATDRRGEHPVDRRVGVGDFLATLYRHLGIDADRATIREPAGRPVPLLQQDGGPIQGLTSVA